MRHSDSSFLSSPLTFPSRQAQVTPDMMESSTGYVTNLYPPTGSGGWHWLLCLPVVLRPDWLPEFRAATQATSNITNVTPCPASNSPTIIRADWEVVNTPKTKAMSVIMMTADSRLVSPIFIQIDASLWLHNYIWSAKVYLVINQWVIVQTINHRN